MATTLSAQDAKTLEQTRQRLFQLSNSLASLQHQILNSDPLPPWSSLHSQTQILSQNLASLSTHLTTHAPLLNSTAVYPLPSYPGRDQEPLLNQLLRKKLEPGVEDWVEQGRSAGEEATALYGQQGASKIRELWEWAGVAANQQARRHEWGGKYTVEEREGPGGVDAVVTGLKRGGKEDSDEDEDEEEEDEGADKKMHDVRGNEGNDPIEMEGKPMPMEDVLRFLMKGSEPKG